MADFVHLHVHTEYSLLDGAARIDQLVEKAKKLKMDSLAITDIGNLHGAVPFYKACKREGIKPIIGAEVMVTDHEYHFVLLAETEQGYKNLMKILSIAHLESLHYKPRVEKETLSTYHEGLIALSGGLNGEVNQYLLEGKVEQAKQVALYYQTLFGEKNFFLEIQNHGRPEQKQINPLLIKLAEETKIPLVATNDVHYIEKQDAIVQDVLMAIGTGHTLQEKERPLLPVKEFYLKDDEQMKALFPSAQEAIANTKYIAARCQVEIPLHLSALPKYPHPTGTDAITYLRALSKKGLEKRYGQVGETELERLDYELSVIERMGFADYFLIVWDFMKYAHQAGIMTGPGRGSAAGSIVAYVLGITNVDPIKYGLLFERFLNPERVNMPDIDIDFNYERREEVIQYVSKKYGADRVAQIITFGTFAARAAIRDVGRVLGIPYGQVDKIAKLIPAQLGITIEKAMQEEKALKEAYQQDDSLQNMIEIARRIEGMPRHHSTHAAGVVIADKQLTEYTPLQDGQEQVSLTQYPMGTLEEIGLLKMDFLGLRNLTIIEKTLDWIEKTHGIRPSLQTVDDQDEATYQLLSRGKTKGVFQLESVGVTKVLKHLKPTHFEDIVAVLALYRPGPMQYIDDYIQAKHGKRTVTYPHESLEAILKDTYGIIVYQEQIMQIASTMAGFTLGEADVLRRAVGKKKKEILMEQRTHFVQGAIQKGYEETVAHEVYDMIVRFADYGFNRSHAVAYGVLAFQTAYLKAHYPVEFMAALLSEWMSNTSKVAEYIEECKTLGIQILSPDVRKSHYFFTVEDGSIRFGLAAIKNIGLQVIETLMNERKANKRYETVMDFCMSIGAKVCNRRVMESLILSGALDFFRVHRSKLLANLDDLMERVQKKKKLQEDLQIDLFEDLDGEFNHEYEWFEVREFTNQEQLQKEKEVLGIYLSGHPLEEYRPLLEKYRTHQVDEWSQLPENSNIVTGGLLLEIKKISTRKGQQMAFAKLEVESQVVELVIFPKVYQQYQQALELEKGILVQGSIQHEEERIKIIAKKLTLLSNIKGKEEHKSNVRNQVVIKISQENDQGETLNKLKDILLDYKGDTPVILYYDQKKKGIRLSNHYQVTVSLSLKEKVEALLGKETIVI